MSSVADLFPSAAGYPFLRELAEPWRLLRDVPALVRELTAEGPVIDASAYVHPNAIVSNSVIGPGVHVYEGCTVRDSVVLGGCTIGHASEVARSILLRDCFVPRFDYVGGSLLGEGVHLGGNVALATRRLDGRTVVIAWGTERIETGLAQFGSLIGDGTTVAFGSHVNPGSVVGHSSVIMPHVDLRGWIPPESMVYVRQRVVVRRRRSFPEWVAAARSKRAESLEE